MRKIVIVACGLAFVACRSNSAEVPEPGQFPEEERTQGDPRSIVFHNESVEMAELEIFVPRKTPADCQVEAPHRLFCPGDYQTLLRKRVYPRSKISTRYPGALGLSCAQVWVRIKSRVMPRHTFREAIFLLGKSSLVLELGPGEAARLDQRKSEGRNSFPAPLRYCGEGTAPVEMRTAEEVQQELLTRRAELKACCAGCRGKLEALLTFRRDGVISEEGARILPSSKGKLDQHCFEKALRTLRLSGFTAAPTRARVTLPLPL